MVYVLSDIHGHEGRFDGILKQIGLREEDTLYVLGDVIDRHPGGIRLLQRLMAMPNVRMLLGNHEYMMLRALGHPYDDNPDDGRALAHWYRNGGEVTHEGFKRLPGAQRREIFAYLRALPVSAELEVNGRVYKLVHGAPVELYDHDPKYKNEIHFSVWKRLEAGAAPVGAYTLVFGHTPTRYYRDTAPMEVWRRDRMIGIDCGCGYPEEGPDSAYGRLACLRLDDGTVFYAG